jgi:hypothetical protein
VTCSIPGMCSRSADCKDNDCPGKPYTPGRLAPLTPQDLADGQRALHTEDGGSWVVGRRVLRLHPRTKPAPTEAATTRSDKLGRAVLIALGVLAALLTAATVFGRAPL